MKINKKGIILIILLIITSVLVVVNKSTNLISIKINNDNKLATTEYCEALLKVEYVQPDKSATITDSFYMIPESEILARIEKRLDSAYSKFITNDYDLKGYYYNEKYYNSISDLLTNGYEINTKTVKNYDSPDTGNTQASCNYINTNNERTIVIYPDYGVNLTLETYAGTKDVFLSYNEEIEIPKNDTNNMMSFGWYYSKSDETLEKNVKMDSTMYDKFKANNKKLVEKLATIKLSSSTINDIYSNTSIGSTYYKKIGTNYYFDMISKNPVVKIAGTYKVDLESYLGLTKISTLKYTVSLEGETSNETTTGGIINKNFTANKTLSVEPGITEINSFKLNVNVIDTETSKTIKSSIDLFESSKAYIGVNRAYPLSITVDNTKYDTKQILDFLENNSNRLVIDRINTDHAVIELEKSTKTNKYTFDNYFEGYNEVKLEKITKNDRNSKIEVLGNNENINVVCEANNFEGLPHKNNDFIISFPSNVPEVTVSFDVDGTIIDTKKINQGSSYGTLPTKSKVGYTFNGWYNAKTNGQKITSSTVLEKANDHTIYAIFTPNKYTISFNTNGIVDNPDSIEVTYDSTYGSLPVLSSDKYNFIGWFTKAQEGDEIKSSSQVKITNNTTLYAHWIKIEEIKIEEEKKILKIDTIGNKKTVAEYVSENSNIKEVLNKNNEKKTTSELISTGDIIKSFDDLEYHVVVIGDINGDGKVTTSDYVKLWNHLDRNNENKISDEYQSLALDINGDGKVTTSDYVKLWNLLKR